MKFRLQWYWVAVLVTVPLVVLLLWRFSSSGHSATMPYTRTVLRGGAEGFVTPAELERLLNRDPSPRAVLEAYRAYAQYPDFSRPLDRTMVDLLDPWKIEDVPLPLVDDPAMRTEAKLRERIAELKAAGKSESQIEEELKKHYEGLPRYQFAANRHTLTLGDTLVVTLKVTAADGGKVDYTITDAVIWGDPQMARSVVGRPEYNDSGFEPDAKAGDGITTFSWKLPGEDRRYWGNLRLVVTLSVRGVKNPVEIQHNFYGAPIVPAQFTGQFQERLENGSLVIEVFLDVKRDCKFIIQGNLYTQRGEPTHWVTANTVLEPGLRSVPLVFFGKIFHDLGAEGRFVLRDLRGTCENLPFPARWLNEPSKMEQIVNAKPLEEPLLFYIPYTNMSYTTQKEYRFKDFSRAEWS
ncbi:MAG: hypothetical protein NZL89_06550, partial [Leptospiraceae bacterium]|nr:hypothetical protein [Leptospiraceae bacterium]